MTEQFAKTAAQALQDVLTVAGGQKALATRLGIRQQSVSEWVARGMVPIERAAQIERLYRVTRRRLRPDVFGAPRKAA
jgi:DNA-binding transcriptional regulator YdaS (Cro superfamily)